MHWCHYCYAVNPRDAGPCIACDQPVEGPPCRSFDDQLVWALGHPDGVTKRCWPPRRWGGVASSGRFQRCGVVDEDRDPYLAVAARRSAIGIAGRDELRGWLEQLAQSESFMLRQEAQRALA